MRKFQCFKVVEAEVIKDIEVSISGEHLSVELVTGERHALPMDIRYIPVAGDYLVRYEDGYLSASPKRAFERGYKEAE